MEAFYLIISLDLNSFAFPSPLFFQEHKILKQERDLLTSFQHMEKSEREGFTGLSNAVRDSHEKERAQAEKTKYWSVIGSVVGTCLGIVGTTINNR